MEETFTCSEYGREIIFKTGQKVECYYYHEYPRLFEKKAYKRKWWQLFDMPFKPVKLGIIVGDAGVHPYWLAVRDGKEQYLLVKFKEYFFAKPIPISCIQDAKESAQRMEVFLKESKHKLGEKGYSWESHFALTDQMNKAKEFTK